MLILSVLSNSLAQKNEHLFLLHHLLASSATAVILPVCNWLFVLKLFMMSVFWAVIILKTTHINGIAFFNNYPDKEPIQQITNCIAVIT